jgi:hypothetical protein
MTLLPNLTGVMKLLILMALALSVFLSTVIVNNLYTPKIMITDVVGELDDRLVSWEGNGFYVEIYQNKVFGIHLKAEDENFQNKTCIVVHGFPSSSFEYSYGAAKGLQSLGYDVILHDHIGFGFSDKPMTGFGYSIHDHADVALAFYESVKDDIRGPVVFIAHDMVILCNEIPIQLYPIYIFSNQSVVCSHPHVMSNL